MTNPIPARLAALNTTPTPDLKQQWRDLFATEPPPFNRRYLCSHRALWYAQENRPPAPIVCTYMGRGDTKTERPFRFILNQSRATVANVYLAMYPTPVLARALTENPALIRPVWEVLCSASTSLSGRDNHFGRFEADGIGLD